MDISIIISSVIGIAVLITFFGMSSKLGAIKDLLSEERNKNAKAEYYVHYANGDKQAAKDKVLYIIFEEVLKYAPTSGQRRAEFDRLTEKYKTHFERLGFEPPEYPF